MQWTHVARKDFADAVRSRLFWALSALMILGASVVMAAPGLISDDAVVEDGINALSGSMLLLIPIIALVIGYMSIVSERETGSIRMMLSLPLERSEVFLGKVVGRTLVMVVPIVIGFALAAPLVFLLYGEFQADLYAQRVLQALLSAVVFVAIAVGVSGAVSSRGKALAGVIGIYAFFEWMWGVVLLGIYWVLNGDVDGMNDASWVNGLEQLSPTAAIGSVAESIFEGISSSEPLIAQEWIGWLAVAAWILVLFAIGRYRFQRANIS
jgi:ABC-2 type transport system permease protein